MLRCALTSDTHYGSHQKKEVWLDRFFAEMAKQHASKPYDVLLLAGDLVACEYKKCKNLFELARKHLGNLPIATVFGNHDYWSEGKYIKGKHYLKPNIDEILKTRQEICDAAQVHNLEEAPLVLKDILIAGFGSWYWKVNPDTNDRSWMSLVYEEEDPFIYMQKRADRQFERVLTTDQTGYRASVLVTHFPPFTEAVQYYDYCAAKSLYPFFRENFDVVCVGHSHRACDFTDEGTRFLNAGVDEDQDNRKSIPKFLVFEV